jgi:uncharacterized repeat protein (TIGR03803 family)
VAQGRDGNLYSSAGLGGINGFHDGAVFKITPGGALTVLYSFNLANSGPYGPFSGLTLGTDGNYYGTTAGGGASEAGTVFKITPSGTVTILHTFNVSDGEEPYAPPIQGTDGNFYGTAVAGGPVSAGTIYKITPSGTFTLLHSFDNTHGSYPAAPLVQGTDGNFYGTAAFGGSPSSYGVVYKIPASGQFTVLYNFDQTNGEEPIGPLIQGSDGNFYGTTFTGGPGGDLGAGVVFKITAAGAFTVLHYFNLNADGGQPAAGLVQATDGNLYGTAMLRRSQRSGDHLQYQPAQSLYLQTSLHFQRRRFLSRNHFSPAHQWHSVRGHLCRRQRSGVRLRRLLQPEHRCIAVCKSRVHLGQGGKNYRDPWPRIQRDNWRFLQRNSRNLQGDLRHVFDRHGPQRGDHWLCNRDHTHAQPEEQQEISGLPLNWGFSPCALGTLSTNITRGGVQAARVAVNLRLV